MDYKYQENDKEIYFKYHPMKTKKNKSYKSLKKDDNPFKVLANINFN